MQMLRARCAACSWEYDCVSLPIPVPAACRAMSGMCCPICGNPGGNLVAPPRALTDAEQRHKDKVAAAAARSAVER